jgi:hypothetical protein
MSSLRDAWKTMKTEAERILGRDLMRNVFGSQDLGPTLDKVQAKSDEFWRATKRTKRDLDLPTKLNNELAALVHQSTTKINYYSDYVLRVIKQQHHHGPQVYDNWKRVVIVLKDGVEDRERKARGWLDRELWTQRQRTR